MIMCHGYIVTVTQTGEQAIREYIRSIENKTKFDIVFLDWVVVGGSGGKETIAELLKN
jgi:hypothetical protein